MKHDQKGFIDADAVTTTFVVLDPVVSKEAQSLIEPYRKDAERYEKLRKLNVPQFAELYKRNIRGEGRFDTLVDDIPCQ